MATKKELEEEVNTLTDVTNCLSKTIHQYNYYFQRKLGATYPRRKKSNENYHCFIPSGYAESVIRRLIYVKRYLQRERQQQLKFLDCGCGVGNILMMALSAGFDVTGIEYELDTYKLGKDLLFKNKNDYQGAINIIRGDILFFRNYKDYDVIYYYTPIMNGELQERFVKKLSKDAKIGAIIIPYDAYANVFEKDPSFKKIGGIEIESYEKIK